MLYGKDGEKTFSVKSMEPSGVLQTATVQRALTRPPTLMPWEKGSKAQQDKCLASSASMNQTSRKQIALRRQGASTEKEQPEKNKYVDYNRILSLGKFQKICFVGISLHGEMMPSWVLTRLETACKSARYELPSNRKLLEEMTPLQYLANFTRLYRGQNRRYANIYRQYKHKFQDCIEYQNLYPALNSMYGNCLPEENFQILCIALFIDSKTMLDLVTFIGVCTFADRLFWTAFLEMENQDSFAIWGPNRTSLEFADFENLKWKLKDLTLSKEMKHLLYSLA